MFTVNIMSTQKSEKPLSWLEQKYLQRQLEVGRHSLDKFSEELGVSQSFISKVMSGKAQPSPETVYQWYKILKDESIFPAFDITPEKRELLELQDKVNQIPADNRREILHILEDWLRRNRPAIK